MTRALQCERVIHIDFREHNTNQIGSGLFTLAFHTSVSNFFFLHARRKVFCIFTKHLAHLSCIIGNREGATFETSIRNYRNRREALHEHYISDIVLIKRPSTCDFTFAWRKRKDSERTRDQLCGEN